MKLDNYLSSRTHIERALSSVDWKLLAQQKQELVVMTLSAQEESQKLLDGLLCFLDGIQDAAELDGYPVVFLTEEEEEATP